MANRFICTDGEGETDEIQSFTALDVKKAFSVNDLDLVRPGRAQEKILVEGIEELSEGMTVSTYSAGRVSRAY